LLALAALFIIPQAFTTQLWQLILFRFLFGMAIGGMLPCITAYIRLDAPIHMQGEVLGYNQSFRFLGNVIGPVLGGIVAGFAGISSVFFVTGFLFIIEFILLAWNIKVSYQKKHEMKESY